MPRAVILFVTGLVLLATARITPARADFFTLDGRFDCFDNAAAACGDARSLPLPPAPPLLAPAAPETIAVPAPPAATSAPRPAASPPAAATVGDPLHAIALRIEARRVASGDLAVLKEAAQRGNTRAIELLAWCALNGIGEPRDPVEAYLLYGTAALAALPHARDNQGAVYESDLDSHQRQQVLDLANEGVAAAQMAP